jgi:hypothetical protein
MRDAIVVNLLREGINKHRARELADHFISLTAPPAQPAPVQEPVYVKTFHGGKPWPLQPAPVQEPIGSLHVDTLALIPTLRHPDGGAKLWPAHKAKYDTSYVLVYTTPPAAQRQWAGLTKEDLMQFAESQYGWDDLIVAVEAKLKANNGFHSTEKDT